MVELVVELHGGAGGGANGGVGGGAAWWGWGLGMSLKVGATLCGNL